MELLKTTPTWFLIVSIVLLLAALALFGRYFLWSVNQTLQGFTAAVDELKELIKELFGKHNDHESRISALEGRCNLMHGDDHRHPGRRYYDHPPIIPESQPGSSAP